MTNLEEKAKLQAKGWKFKVGKAGHSATHTSGLREFAPSLTELLRKIRGY